MEFVWWCFGLKFSGCGSREKVFVVGVEGFGEAVVLDASADDGEDVVGFCGVCVLTSVECQVFEVCEAFHTLEDWLCG